MFLTKTYSRSTGLSLGQAVLLGLLCEVGLIYTGTVQLTLVSLAIGGMVLSGWGIVHERTWPGHDQPCFAQCICLLKSEPLPLSPHIQGRVRTNRERMTLSTIRGYEIT